MFEARTLLSPSTPALLAALTQPGGAQSLTISKPGGEVGAGHLLAGAGGASDSDLLLVR